MCSIQTNGMCNTLKGRWERTQDYYVFVLDTPLDLNDVVIEIEDVDIHFLDSEVKLVRGWISSTKWYYTPSFVRGPEIERIVWV